MTEMTTARGIAALLAANGVGAYSETEGYPDGQVGIYIKRLPDGGDVIRVFPYPLADDPERAVAEHGIQIVCRADIRENPIPSYDLADAVHELLQGAHSLTLANGVQVTEITRVNGTHFEDESDRTEVVNSYRVTVNAQLPNLL